MKNGLSVSDTLLYGFVVVWYSYMCHDNFDMYNQGIMAAVTCELSLEGYSCS